MPIAPEYLHLIYQGPFPCYLYGRNSRDPKKKGRSVGDQLHEGQSLADQFTWPVAGIFKDTGISATRHARKRRDDFEEMLDGIRARKVRLVVAYEASRYYRDLEVYVRIRKACEEAGVLLCYNGQIYDLSKSEDRRATAQDALQAESEGEAIRDRNMRTVRLNAERGRPHGPVLDGYKRRYDPDSGELIDQVIHPERATVVTAIWEMALSGRSILAIEREMASRRTLTQHGKPITRTYIRRMLTNPGYMGRRVFQGKDHAEATWPALVSPADFYKVQAVLAAPDRQTSPGPERTHLLSGIMLCGEHPELRATASEPRCEFWTNNRIPSIRCSADYHTTVQERMAVAAVESGVLGFLSSSAAEKAFLSVKPDASREQAQAQLGRLQAQLDEARAMTTTFKPDGTPVLSVASLAAMEARLLPMIEEAQKTARPPAELPDLLRELVGNSRAGSVWEDLELDQQRMVLRLVVTPRLFRASRPGVRSLEPGRITLSYRGQPGFMGDRPRGRVLPPAPDLPGDR
ncbi:recombinase family protein [Streptomyces xanthophaeus]|uniref:recombinase family protein n=1 Tax=Streptomyces xanthophaeus TaxID=67385 RepID=UPI002646FFED|nr:recombinase family protein [Streptomyces xanthophaeus]WKD36566.1 recombinase family protein [Streptomyces xanthophaeus]